MAVSQTLDLTTRTLDADDPRVRQLRSLEIDYIPNPNFEADASSHEEEFDLGGLADGHKAGPADLPAHLRSMCETDLLSADQERALFREMNLLKFRADRLRARHGSGSIDAAVVDEIEGLVSRSQAIRDHIIRANMRLVMSIVKKFVTPQQSFDDMLSDGIMTLMQAVEKFDFDRGFRFSTYAYRSIARNAYRTVTVARRERARFAGDSEVWACEPEDQAGSTAKEQLWGSMRELAASMVNNLDRRERFIIRSRYALGSHRRVRTFQYLADKLGVSKERVRQLEQRAVSKLRTMADESQLEEMLGPVMA